MRRVTSDEGLLPELVEEGFDFFTGVPDSGLGHFIAEAWRLPREMHVPATWEAEAVAIAAGVYLGGGRPCVYLQNAGLGHVINPLTSLCVPYGIKMRLVVGHRHSLPQHRVMGEIDAQLLELIGWEDCVIVDSATDEG